MAGPRAYFISFRCYGTWLHGDARGSVDATHNRHGDDRLAPDPGLETYRRGLMARSAMALTQPMRDVVAEAIRQTCDQVGWVLVAVAVQSNHVHVVVAAPDHTPERVMNSLKSWSTRRLREAGLLKAKDKPWSRHGSTRYLWTDEDAEWAAEYVRHGQDVPWDEKKEGRWTEW